MKQMAGFSLIEMVIFIVVTGIAVAGIFTAFRTATENGVGVHSQTVASNLANARMAVILGQERMLGFSSFTDPCASGSPPAVCTLPSALSAYSVSSTIVAEAIGGDSNYKIITVTVSGPNSAAAALKTLVGS